MTTASNRQPPRVLSLHWGYSLGGVGKYGVLLDRAAKKNSIDIHHLCIRGHSWQVDFNTLAQLEAEEIVIESRLDLSWIRKLSRYIRNIRPTLIMTHGFNGHFVAQLMSMLGSYKGQAICSYHGQYHAITRSRYHVGILFNHFTEWYIRKSLKTVSVAEYTKDYLITRGVSPERIEVIHNGIEDLNIEERAINHQLRTEWRIGDEDVVIGVASRLDPVKGVGYLVSAFSHLAERHANIVLVLVGSGTEEQHLRSQVDKYGIGERVRFVGFRSDVAECLAVFDIFVLPSLAEYHSIGLLEAMRAAKSIVATDVGGNTESVRDRKEALVVAPGSTEELEKALEMLLSDPSLCERLAKNARERYTQKFTEDVMLDRTATWLKECLELAARPKC